MQVAVHDRTDRVRIEPGGDERLTYTARAGTVVLIDPRVALTDAGVE